MNKHKNLAIFKSEPKLSMKIKVGLILFCVVFSIPLSLLFIEEIKEDSIGIVLTSIPIGLLVLLIGDIDVFVVLEDKILMSDKKIISYDESLIEIPLSAIKDCHVFQNSLYVELYNGDEKKILSKYLDCFDYKNRKVSWDSVCLFINDRRKATASTTASVRKVPLSKIQSYNKIKYFLSGPKRPGFRIAPVVIGIIITICVMVWRKI